MYNDYRMLAKCVRNNELCNKAFKWTKIIVARYMGNDKAEEYGRRNSSSKDELLIKIKPTKVIGQKDIAGW